jgi:hypothetical protein
VHRLATPGRILKGEKPACGSQVRPSARFAADCAVSALIEKEPRVRRAGSMARLSDLGSAMFVGSSADFETFIVNETEKWSKVIRAANIKPE